MATEEQLSTKACTRCGMEQPLSAFYTHRRNCDGHSGICKACRAAERAPNKKKLSEKSLAWYRTRVADGTFVRHRNPEADKQYRERNKAKLSARSIAWAKANRLRIAAIALKYVQSHKEKINYRNAVRRARRKGAGGSHTIADLKNLRAQQHDCCVYCDQRLNGGGHLDHIYPLARGGSDGIDNLQYLCRPCNQKKSDIDPIEYAKSIGILGRIGAA